MNEIVSTVTRYFNVTKEDIKPKLHPPKSHINARIMTAYIMREKGFTIKEIVKAVFSKDASGVYLLLNNFKIKESELKPIFDELLPKFDHLPNLKDFLNCMYCKKDRNRHTEFNDKSRFCTVCQENIRNNKEKPKKPPKPKLRPMRSAERKKQLPNPEKTCRSCKRLVKRESYRVLESGTLSSKCPICENNDRLKKERMPKVDRGRLKKDDGNFGQSDYSTKVRNKSSALEALKKAKEIEANKINNGGKYVRDGVRAYVLKQ